jgi:DNA invertase Pin-like site-specific DNA recombinase
MQEIYARNEEVRRAYSYVRFSTGKQAKGDSERRQTEFRNRILEKYDAVLDDSLRMQDFGVSAFRGKNAKKGALSYFIDAIESGRVSRGSILIIEALDRLSREPVSDHLELFIRILNAGVIIVTAQPEKEYTKASIKDIAGLVEPIVYMSRAHDESKMKSWRLLQIWGQKRLKARNEKKPMTRMTPAWIGVDAEGRFYLIPERSRVVAEIFRIAREEGKGSRKILMDLNANPELYPPFEGKRGRKGRRGRRWTRTYVEKILASRAAFGEYQPYRRDENGKKVPDGDPVPNYYPAVVTEDEFYLVREAQRLRKKHSGRPAAGERAYNLFTGLVHNAVTKTVMRMGSCLKKGKADYYRFLAPAAEETCMLPRGGQRLGVPYDLFETAFLRALESLRPKDVLRRDKGCDAREAKISELTAQLVAQDHKVKTLKERAASMAEAGEDAAYNLLLDTMVEAAKNREATVKQLEQLKAESLTGRSETLGEVQSLAQLYAAAEGEERAALARRIKARLGMLVEEIWVYSEPIPGCVAGRGAGRWAAVVHVQTFLRKRRNGDIAPRRHGSSFASTGV